LDINSSSFPQDLTVNKFIPTKIRLKMASTNDPTFRHYQPAQASSYAQWRGSYDAALYEEILAYHKSTGGELNTLLDVGCGPGSATRDLALCFRKATGVDPGKEMINTAGSIGGETGAGDSVEYFVGDAEDVGEEQGVQDGSVDLLTAAMAVGNTLLSWEMMWLTLLQAHWFRMDEFWRNASKILKPGGTVALWTCASMYCREYLCPSMTSKILERWLQTDPSTPQAAKVQKILSNLEDNILGPYATPYNKLSRGLYADLPLPWDVNPPIEAFAKAKSQFVRREWDRDGILSNGKDFFLGANETTLERLGNSLGTASMVTRWREAHPELVGTDQDCVKSTMDEIARVLGEDESVDLKSLKIRTGSAVVLLLFKRVWVGRVVGIDTTCRCFFLLVHFPRSSLSQSWSRSISVIDWRSKGSMKGNAWVTTSNLRLETASW
jgi:SAM-dependent methyltransferase